MRTILKGALIFGVSIAFLAGGFSLYAHFLMDYSLDNLAFAVSVTQKDADPAKTSPLAQQVYQSIVEDLTVQEATQENVDFKNLVLLDLASRSFEEVEGRAGYARAKVYLNQIAESKSPDRHPVLRWLDSVTRKAFEFFQSVCGFFNYAFEKMNVKKPKEQVELGDFAAALLLNRAQENERAGDLSAAIIDYRKFLQLHPGSADFSLATLSLANILIKQRKYDDAQKLLEQMQMGSFGSQEGDLASKLIKKINTMKAKERLIEELEALKLEEKDPRVLERINFRLALAYLATNQLEKAQYLFDELTRVTDKKLQDKAKFYLGWVYKLKEEYGKSAEIFMKLLEDPKIKTDFELGLRAQLADIYYKTGNVSQSLTQYQALSQKAKQSRLSSRQSVHAAWVAFSELEQANIYYFDMKDIKRAKDSLNALGTDVNLGVDFEDLEFKLQESSRVNLRDMGFQLLVSGKNPQKAMDLFLKDSYRHPSDALTVAGLATAYILMGDLESAYDYAQKAYQMMPNEYTTSLFAYILGLNQNYDEAIKKYKEVIKKYPESIAAKFNLAYMLLRIQQFQDASDFMNGLEESLAGDEKRKYVRSKTLNNLGYAYWGLGNVQKAEEEFRKALELSPDFNIAQQNLDQLALGETPRAVKLEG